MSPQTSRPIHPVPAEYRDQVDVSRVQSVKGCGDGECCLDVYPLTGNNVLIVSDTGKMTMSMADFEGLKDINL